MTRTRSRFLLISRVGPQSLHHNWLTPSKDRQFDLLLSAYDSVVTDPGSAGLIFEYRPGPKVAGYGEILREHADLISQYDYVALFDDDLMISSSDLQRLFEIVAARQLKIAQPALTHDSHFTFAALLQDRAFRLRFINYIEMMCPIFRADVLQAIRPLYEMGFESGIDLIWCNLVATSLQDFAVIDEVPVRHTRGVGTSKAANGFADKRRYEDDIYAILAKFDLPWLSCVPYAGVTRNGSVIRRRAKFFWSSLRLVRVVAKGPHHRLRAISIATNWKHLLTRKAMNVPIMLPSSDI